MRARCLLLLAIACRGGAPPAPSLRVDAPRLENATGTLALDRAILEVPSLAALPDRPTTMPAIAADRAQLARPLLDALQSRGVRPALLVVRAGSELRMVVVEQPAAHMSSDRPLRRLAVGSSTLEVDGHALATRELAASLAQADVILELAPEVTLQRLVEVAAGAGGELHPVPAPVAPVPVVAP